LTVLGSANAIEAASAETPIIRAAILIMFGRSPSDGGGDCLARDAKSNCDAPPQSGIRHTVTMAEAS
jgi:hypothetical protein